MNRTDALQVKKKNLSLHSSNVSKSKTLLIFLVKYNLNNLTKETNFIMPSEYTSIEITT